VDIKTDARSIVVALLEQEDDEDYDDFREIVAPDNRLARRFHPELVKLLERLGIGPNRIITYYSDVYIMCRTQGEALQVLKGGNWKSMGEVVQTNPDHPIARKYPWLCDIPFANLSRYINSKTQHEGLEDGEDDIDWKDVYETDTPATIFTGKELAKEYARVLTQVTDQEPGSIRGIYAGNGWIRIEGNNRRDSLRWTEARAKVDYFNRYGKFPPTD